MSERFYVNRPLAIGQVSLEGPEAHHLAAVCRLRPGDAVCLFNGDGRQYPAEVLDIDRRTVTLQVQSVESPERELPFQLEVAVPLPKGDRAQFLVEKLTELGVTRLVPLRTARSIVHPGENKQEKLKRWVIEASKQCGRNVLMEIAALADWETYCCHENLPQLRWIAHPESKRDMTALPKVSGLAAAVGPEGGFTPAEVEMALASGWQPIGLGPRVLRVETAAIVIATLAVGLTLEASS
jgi:16S rRNA (uracil1498-N3)-methyltransferase